jgi:glutathione S-transferase
MSNALKLFELAGADAAVRFSPYCWRARLALAHKGLPVETIPWRFTEKEAIAVSGQGKVPVLIDGERCVYDSWAIAEYLEAAYPDRPSLFGSPEARALARFVNCWTREAIHPALGRIIAPGLPAILAEKDRAYFVSSREARFGVSLAALAERRDESLAALRRALAPLRGALADQPYLAGAAPNYADHIVFGAFQWARVASPVEILAADDSAIAAWRERMLDAYGGLARRAPRAV